MNCSAAADGGLPGYFLDLGSGVRSLGMGRAYTAVSGDSSAIHQNPSGLTDLQKANFSGGHIILFEDTRYNYINLAFPYGKNLSIGASMIQLASTGIEVRDAYNNTGGSIDDYKNAYHLSIGYMVNPKFRAGASVKGIHYLMDDINILGYGLDGSVLYKISNDLQLGLKIKNLIKPVLERESGKYSLPLSIKTGLSWKIIKPLLLSGDIEKNELSENYKMYFGSEFRKGILRLRAGYDESYLTGGLGISINNYKLDYAILNHPLDYSHRMDLTYLFGKERDAVEIPKPAGKHKKTRDKTVEIVKMKDRYNIIIRTPESIPCAIYDLLEKKGFSVVSTYIENKMEDPARAKIICKIEGKTSELSDEFQLRAKEKRTLSCYPRLLTEDIRKIAIHEPVYLNTKIYASKEIEPELTLIAEKSVKTVLDPYDHYFVSKTDASGKTFDLTDTIVSWITFNDRKLSEVLSFAADQGTKLVPPVKIIGNQQPKMFTRIIEDERTLQEKGKDYDRQIKLIYDTLKDKFKVRYLNQPVFYNKGQRVKYPAQTLKEKGNCIELTVLIASLLESIEIEPIVALFPEDGHAAVGWRVSKDDEESFHLIETNMFGEDYSKLVEKGKKLVDDYDLNSEFDQGIPFDNEGIYKKGQQYILLDVKKIRERIPPSPYIGR